MPYVCLLVALGNTFAGHRPAKPKPRIKRNSMLLICCLAIPFHGLFVVFGNAVAKMVYVAKLILSRSIALFRRQTIPLNSLFGVTLTG